MSCNGCRVLRKGCGENCVLKPCLEWIQSPDAQGHATLFISKFFGRSDLINFITAVPSGHQRTALFQSLLFEAVGRTVNPVNGAMGFLSTGKWHLLEAAVQTVLAGGSPTPLGDETLIAEVDESSEVFQARGAWAMMMIRNQTDAGNSNAIPPANVLIADDNNRNFSIMPVSDGVMEFGMSSQRSDGEEPKLLNLFQ
ncbi:hypothetical protein L2E82_27201 [Cichorium intybus]|uniref:Uncharacterized protein n=1 Tax=Cichorium intybus TaxID=13427 RepID=A0ACB9CSG0_CICIN|nr:hypothetical protein L2E82_27201 [Cichorium intybus]